MKYDICLYGNPVLREKAEPVSEVDGVIRALIKDMILTMHEENGIGLAAEQIGKHIALCVVDVPAEEDADKSGKPLHDEVAMPLALINPEIVEASSSMSTMEEGCLSFPGIYVAVKRPDAVRVAYLDQDGKPSELNAGGLLARAIQHEMDHLNGVLLVDHMSQVKKIACAGKLKRLKQSAVA